MEEMEKHQASNFKDLYRQAKHMVSKHVHTTKCQFAFAPRKLDIINNFVGKQFESYGMDDMLAEICHSVCPIHREHGISF